MLSYLKCALTVSAVLSIGGGCARTHASVASPSAETGIVTPSPAPTWPSYSALGYDRPGHPSLTSQQAKLIRKTLALLKPCQAAQLRYAFPDWRYSTNSRDVVLYFDYANPAVQPHVLWTYNEYYDRTEGRGFPIPYDNRPGPKGIGTASEVRQKHCNTLRL